MARPQVAVVGAGIVGASLAYHLARQGAAVTLLDRGEAAAGVTAQSFAWINVVHGAPEPQLELRRQALAEWHRLRRELGPALAIDWCGALTWQRDPAATEGLVAAHQAAGYDLRLIQRAEIATLEPGLLHPPACAAWAPDEGALDPAAATQALVAGAAAAGAVVRLGCAVQGVTSNADRITGLATAAGPLAADRVVLAAGVATASLSAPLGLALPLAASPAILVRLRAPGCLLRRIVSMPRLELRQAGPERLLGAEEYLDETAANGPAAVAERLLAAIREEIRGGEGVSLESVAVGQRPMPADGAPLVGPAPSIAGLYVAALHAGVIMAPLIGRLAAAEILSGRPESLLRACRPGRQASGA